MGIYFRLEPALGKRFASGTHQQKQALRLSCTNKKGFYEQMRKEAEDRKTSPWGSRLSLSRAVAPPTSRALPRNLIGMFVQTNASQE